MDATSQWARSRLRTGGALALCGVVLLLGLGRHVFATSAPPLARTVALVEADPGVIATVGSPASVSLVRTRVLRRDVVRALSGDDAVDVLSTVVGPRGRATFRLDARNVDGQGWAGTFAIEVGPGSVLQDGRYVATGGGAVLEGDFAPDGTPRVKRP